MVLGKRRGYPTTQMPPHNLTMTVIGASLLWVGWFGFNAGSELAADGVAGMAMAVTQIATAGAALAWMFTEWVSHGKPSVLGIASGAVAGLVAITPASGSVGPMGALAIGCVRCGLLLYRDQGQAGAWLRRLAGRVWYPRDRRHHRCVAHRCVCRETFGGAGLGDGNESISAQVFAQFVGVAATVVYTGIASFIILKVVGALTGGLRVSEEEETEGWISPCTTSAGTSFSCLRLRAWRGGAIVLPLLARTPTRLGSLGNPGRSRVLARYRMK